MEKTWWIKLPEWLVWRFYEDSVEADALYSQLIWRLSGVFMAKTW